MKHLFITILLLLPLCRMLAQEREYVIVVHGGAGAMAVSYTHLTLPTNSRV